MNKKNYRLFLISPVVMLGIPWLLVIFLYSFGATTNLVPIPLTLKLFLAVLLFLTLTLQIIFTSTKIKFVTTDAILSTSLIKLYIKRVGMVWLLGSVFEVFFSGGLPIFWAIQGSSKDYTNFGIPSLHGFMNALYFAIVGCVALDYFNNHKKKELFYLVLLIFWPLLMLGRGILLTASVQITIIYVFFNDLSYKVLLRVLLFVFITPLIFGFIGDFRGTANPFQYLISEPYIPIFEVLPAGFLWMYIYLTSPLSNYAFNVGYLEPVWDLYFSTVNLFPSFLRPETLDRADNFYFVDAGLNVSTIFASSHSDFGYLGDSIVMVLLLSWTFFWFLTLQRSNYFILPYAMVCSVLVFSVFYNIFLLYPYLLATLLQGYISYNCMKKSVSGFYPLTYSIYLAHRR